MIFEILWGLVASNLRFYNQIELNIIQLHFNIDNIPFFFYFILAFHNQR